LQDLPYPWVSVVQGELAALDPADLAAGLVGAERVVDPAKPCEGRLEPGRQVVRGEVVADVDADGSTHDVIDTAGARSGP
jgi:hypothetical protein